MKFRLLYRGQIRPRQKAGLNDIHAIRREFHPQIKRLWDYEPLKGHRKFLRFQPGNGHYGLYEEVGDRIFVPLVSKRIEMIVSLEIVLLRTQAPGQLVSEGGDIDNRIKTLFDALRVPSNAELKQLGSFAEGDESPFHCLLQDDSLITRVAIETDRLLVDAEPNELIAIIQVDTRLSRATMDNAGLMG